MSYLVPRSQATVEFTERRSRFIGHIFPVTTEEQALTYLSTVRKRHREATHNVYAYKVRREGIMRHSDDGEPQGTAGLPVLNVLQKHGVTDVLCVVTRYFGGILLGAGGLVRAYGHSAKLALDAAGIGHMTECIRALLSCPYSLWEQVARLLPPPLEPSYGADVTCTCIVPLGRWDALCSALMDETAGQVTLLEVDRGLYFT